MAKASYIGHQNVMQAFDRLRPKANAFFSVWVGTNLYYQYNGQDAEEGRDVLSEMLLAAQEQRNRDILIIKFHPGLDGDYITNKTKIIGQIPVCAYNPEDENDSIEVSGVSAQHMGGRVDNAVWYRLKAIEDKFDSSLSIDSRIKALEDKKADVSISGFSWQEQIGELLKQPGAMETVGGILTPLVGSVVELIKGFVPVKSAVVEPLIISGTDRKPEVVKETKIEMENNHTEFSSEDNEKMDEAITRLTAHCDPVIYLPALANFADNNPEMFKGLLKTLIS